MAIKQIFHFTALTGGAATALDSVDGNSLLDLDRAFVMVAGILYIYELDADSGIAESSPNIISPDTNAGTKRWILQSVTVDSVIITDLTASRAVLTDANKMLVSDEAATGTGAPVRATSPTLVTPLLGTPTSGTLDNCTTDTAADNDSSTQLASTAFAKSQDAVLAREPDQGVALTAAASGSSGITVTDNNNIDLGSDNFTLIWKGSLPDWTPAESSYLVTKISGSNGVDIRIHPSGTIGVDIANIGTFYSTVATGFVDGTIHEISVVVIRESASIDGSVVYYVDGIVLGSPVAITAGSPISVTNSETLRIMGDDVTSRTAGTINHTYIFTRALTATEVRDLYRNRIAEADKWGNQTSIITGNDSTFAGASNWANVDLNAYNETTDLTITATASGQYCTLPVANAGTTAAKKYRLSMDVANIVSTWTIKSFDGTQTIGTISANGTAQKIEFTASTTGGLRIVAAANDSSGDFDNFLLYEIGATFALVPENITLEKWYDASSNALDATYPTVGWSLVRKPSRKVKQPTPTAETTAVTLTIAKLLTGIITATHTAGATQAYTLPTGALCDAWPAFGINDSFDWSLVNLSAAAADTVTVTADTGHTIVGNPIVQSAHSSTGGVYGNSSLWRTRKTAVSTFVTYRIA